MQTTPEDWAALYNQNMISIVRLVQLLAPAMKERGWGRMVNVSSGVATQPLPNGADYSAVKAAVVNSTVSLAKELGGFGITVNTLMPGTILTEGLERVFRGIAAAQDWGEEWAEIERRAVKELFPNPTGRLGRVADIANAVTFLASPLAGFINGANLRVDGGYVTAIN